MTGSKIKVSVIVPIYNAERYLRQNLQSIANQTLKDIEIICVDDGSTDSSFAIAKEFAESDSRFILVSQENAGAGAARNNGLRKARGEYLSFLDADDFFEKDMLEIAYKKVEETKADIVVFNSDQYLEDEGHFKSVPWVIKYSELPPYQPFNRHSIMDNIFKVFVGWPWDKLFRRDWVLENDLWFQEQRTTNDMLFVFSAVALAKRIAYVEKDKILAHHRCNNKDSLSNTREKSWDCFYKALCALRERLKADNIYDECEKDYINYALHASLWNLNTLAEPTYQMLFNKLKSEWFGDLDIEGKPSEYFYNKEEYSQYLQIMKYSKEEYKTKISVVIPVYNAEKYIRECLDSILEHQNIELEVICVDDCSTDDTPKILEEYKEKYENFTVLRNENNLFAGESRNRGLLAAKGQYIHFLDADDLVIKDSYKKLYKMASENDLDWLKTTCEAFDDTTGESIPNRLYDLRDVDKWLDGKMLDFNNFPKKFFDIAVVPWNGIYKREFLIENNIRFNNLRCVNDRSFYVTTCVKGRRMMITRTTFVKYRVNVEDSLVTKRGQYFDCQFRSYELMEDICNDNAVSEKVRFEILEHEMYDMFVWYRRFNEQGLISESLKQEMKAFLKGERLQYFESYGKKSRWFKFRDLIGV